MKVDFRIPDSDDGRVQARQLLQDDSMATRFVQARDEEVAKTRGPRRNAKKAARSLVHDVISTTP